MGDQGPSTIRVGHRAPFEEPPRKRWVQAVWERSLTGEALYLSSSARLVHWARRELALRAGGAARTGMVTTLKGLQERFPPPHRILPELECRLLQAQVARRLGDGGGQLPSSGYLEELYQGIQELEGRWPAPPTDPPSPVRELVHRWMEFRHELEERRATTSEADLWDLPERLRTAGFAPDLVVLDTWPALSHAEQALRSFLRQRATVCVDLDLGEGGIDGARPGTSPSLVSPSILQGIWEDPSQPAFHPLAGPVRLTEYRNEQDEVEGLARRLRERLDADPDSSVMVALADLPRYADRVLEVFPRYGLRPRLELRPELRSDRSSQVMRVLLAIFEQDFALPSVLELLQTLDSRGRLAEWFTSPIGTVRRVLFTAGARSGRGDYTELVATAFARLDRPPRDLREGDFSAVAQGFARLFAGFPEPRPQPLRTFLDRLERACARLEGKEAGSLPAGGGLADVLARARESVLSPEDEAWAVRDLRTFVDLVLTLARAPGRPFPLGVPVSGLRDAAALPVDHLFVGGLRRGAFPSSGPSPWIPSESRRALGLPRDRDLLAQEREVFLTLLGQARRTLELSYPRRVDGEETLPSPFLTEFLSATGSRPVGAPRETGPVVYSLKDAILAWTGTGALEDGPQATGAGPGDALPAALLNAGRGLRVERQRRCAPREGAWDGPVGEASVRDRLSRLLVRAQINVHQLQSYLECAYRFYLTEVLAVPTEAPEVGDLDRSALGTLLHKVLEDLQRGLVDAQGHLRGIRPDEVAKLQAQGARQIEEGILRMRPVTPVLEVVRRNLLGPPGQPERGVLRQTLNLLATEAGRYEPAYVELAIGPQPRDVGGGEGPSPLPPWRIGSRSGGEWSLVGRVDRVSWDRQRPGSFVVEDFKTGWSRPDPRPAKDDLPPLQLPLYAAALSDLLPAGSAGERPVPGDLRYLWLGRPGQVAPLPLTKGRGDRDREIREIVSRARSLAQAALSGIEKGLFPINGRFLSPDREGCRFSRHCAFALGCRFDPERLAGTFRGGA